MRRLLPFRLFVGTAGALSLLFAGGHPLSAGEAARSPLLAQSPAAHAFVLKLADLIRDAAGGQLTAENAREALRRTIQSHPDMTPALLAAALNQMNPGPDTLKAAIAAAAEYMALDQGAYLSAMITHTYMNHGKDAAYARMDTLRIIFGADTLTNALDGGTFALLKPAPAGNLPNIQPRAGGELYDG